MSNQFSRSKSLLIFQQQYQRQERELMRELIKICNTCHRVLSVNNFYWKNKEKGYRRSSCKKCNKNRATLYKLCNQEHVKEYQKQYMKRYYENNKKHLKQKSSEYKINNCGKVNALTTKRKAMKLNQTPDNANLSIIQFYYTVCDTMGGYEVDHIKPLSKGGLHHQDNLQILEAGLNREKHAKWPLTEKEKIRYKGYRL